MLTNHKIQSDLDALVQEVRARVAASIQERCGTMQVLDMEQPIAIDSIYTSVNVLKKMSRNRWRTVDELLEGFDGENFDRFILSKKQQCIPILKAVEEHGQLLILGKPGSGKTTFLKWLALQCAVGSLYEDFVPFFVTLKEFAESEGTPSLIDFLAQQLGECGIEKEESTVEQILRGGRAMILLDGLDEVRSNTRDRIINTISRAPYYLYDNQLLMTCRIASEKYMFEHFAEVEIADFNPEQIADFARKWFQSKDPVKIAKFSEDLEKYPKLKELGNNPLLLTLLCLLYGERVGFPANCSELYKKCLNLLMEKWDSSRDIGRDGVHKYLSLQQKEELLSQIAGIIFERGDYFFTSRLFEEELEDIVFNIQNDGNDPEMWGLDNEDILDSIAAQHGLLVERSNSIYSFSHLAFQEYFTDIYREKNNTHTEAPYIKI